MTKTLILVSAVMLTAGCFAPKQVAQTKQTFTFDYAVKEAEKPGSATMVLALVSPYYAAEFTSGSGELFKSFQEALRSDIEELVVAKGFSLKGPYVSHDEMIFEDKKRTDVLIQIEIAPRFTAQAGGWKTNISLQEMG